MMTREEWEQRCVRSALIYYERGERSRKADRWRPINVREAIRVLGITEEEIGDIRLGQFDEPTS